MRFILLLTLLAASACANPAITEFMADNAGMIADEDAAFSDWIEIHNPTTAPIALQNYCLTDDAANLVKWRFPAVTLDPGGFLIVWASGKDRTNPAAPLHTNFSLAKGGEFLALVHSPLPSGPTTVLQNWNPYPSQAENESHGLQFTSTTLVAPGASAKWHVPSSSVLGTTWRATAFSDTGWTSGTTGLGFGLMVPGILVREVKKGAAPLATLADTDALMSSGGVSETTIVAPTVNFLGEGADGHYAGNQVFPNGGGDYFAIKATGFIQIPSSGYYTFGMNSDDGGRIRINGANVMVDDTNHGPADHMGWVFLASGLHSFEAVMWEQGGGDECEIFAGTGQLSAWSAAMKLVGDTANGGLAAFTFPQGVGGGAGVLIGTNTQTQMQNINATCYTRVPFTAAGPGAFTSLSLKMRYNDGCAVFLNGTQVAAKNSPVSPVYNSTATAARTTGDSFVAELVNITAQLPSLISGTNVLAIHGMNVTAADGTFLVLPELIAGTLNTAAQSVFYSGSLATPGGINGAYSLLGKVEDTQFSVKRGFFTAPFSLAITSDTPGATIRYTTNGSAPTATTGTVYTAPISIAATTVIRAAAFLTGWEPTDVDTQTYIFINDVIAQSPTGAPPPGWPATSGTSQVLDYGMDPDIVNHADPSLGGAPQVKAALVAIPSVSLVTDLPNLFNIGGSQGIVANPGGRGFAWERPCSIEWINPPSTANPNGTDEFQINCGVRIRGGFSRDPNNPKHGFHLYFREDYGDSKLRYPLFGRHGADEFDQLDLRTAQNYSWSFSPGSGNQNSFLHEEVSRQTQLDMGHQAGRVRYFHLYINGHYWGLWDTEERTEASFASTYFGGKKDDYDVIKCEQTLGYTTGFTDGNMAAWQDLWNKSKAHLASPTNANYFKMMGLAADGVTPTADPLLLDVDNLVDFLLLNFWMGNADGAASPRANNWFGARDRTGAHGGFKFFAHDFEHSMLSTGEDRTGPYINADYANFTYSMPMFLHQDLMANAEYRIRWADRVHKHMFNGGKLTAAVWTERLNKMATIVDSAIIAESARWGDSKSPTTPFTRNNWLIARNNIINSVVPARGPTVLAQLRGDGLYPALDAPAVTPFGGYVNSGSEATMTVSAGTIYHMPDGSDPRAVGGAIRPGALIYSSGTTNETLIAAGASWKHLGDGSNQGTAWRAAGFDDTAWPAGNAELGYGDGDEATTLPTVDVDAVAAGVQRNATSYFRKTFTVTDTTNVTGANLSLKYDDQAWVYLDGALIVKTNSGMPDNPAFNFYTGANTPDESLFFNFPISPALLPVGTHTLAVEVHQGGSGSSDVSFNLALTLSRTTSPTPLYLTGAGVRPLKARAFDGTNWSALADATFLVDTEPASTANLAISEIMYHPGDPTPAEIAAGFTNADDFEYIEFTNIGPKHVDLLGVHLYGPVDFDFTGALTGRTLAPGARVLIAAKKSAFEFRYGPGKPVAGSYKGNLDNGGEALALYTQAETAIRDFAYGDSAPWPAGADGHGFSLVRKLPSGDPAADALPENWRPSTAPGGNPGTTDASTFAGWKLTHSITDDNSDSDGDGVTAKLEYVLGGNPAASDISALPTIAITPLTIGSITSNYITIRFQRRVAADDVNCTVESTDFAGGWTTGAAIAHSVTPAGPALETVVYRSVSPFAPAPGSRQSYRVKAIIAP